MSIKVDTRTFGITEFPINRLALASLRLLQAYAPDLFIVGKGVMIALDEPVHNYAVRLADIDLSHESVRGLNAEVANADKQDNILHTMEYAQLAKLGGR